MSSRRPHKHLIIDATIVNPPKDEQAMKAFLVAIIESIGMTLAKLTNDQSNPIAWYCDEQGNEGMTAGAILTTSHVVLHVWDNVSPAELHFDLYSCSDFDPQEIANILSEKFGITTGFGLVRDRLTGETKEFRLQVPEASNLVNQEIVNYAKKLSW